MSQAYSIEDAIGVIKRRALLVVGVGLIGAALSIFYALSLPRVYEAEALMQIELPTVVEPAPVATGSSPGARAKYRLTLIEQQLMARDSLLQIARELGLFTDKGLTDSQIVQAMREAITIRQIIDPQEAWRPDAMPSGLSITVRLGDAEKAAETANLLLDRMLEQAQLRRQQETAAALAFYQEEEARVSAKIDALEERIARFKAQNAQSLPEALSALRDELVTLGARDLEFEAEILGLRSGTSRERAEVLARRIEDLEAQKALIESRIAQIEAAIARAPEVERQLAQMNREREQLQEQFAAITRGKAEAEFGKALERSKQAEHFEVLERAVVPDHPVAPSRKKIAFLGTLIALTLGVLMAMLLEALNPAIRTAAQLERQLGIAPVVSIPEIEPGGRRRGMIAALLGLGALGGVLALPSLRDAIEALAAKLHRAAAPARPVPVRVSSNTRPGLAPRRG